jgi:hydrogenase maturation protease
VSRVETSHPRVVVIGVGNPYRSDDGVGPEVVRRVDAAAPRWVEVLEHDGEPAGLLDAWDEADLAVVVDAVSSPGVSPGHLHRAEMTGANDLTSSWAVSSHGISPGVAIELAGALGRLPRRLVLYGIQGKTFAPGLGLSTEVEASVERVVDRILKEVAANVP